MAATQGQPLFDSLAQRWHELADRRLAHFTELYQSGRWRCYYPSEQQFALHMLDVIRAAKAWAQLAGREPRSVSMPVAAATETSQSPTTLPARAELATAPKRNRLRPAA